MQAEPREALEAGLSPADLQTLLMAVSQRRAAAVTPARLMERWQSDRFVRAAGCDPRLVWELEARLWALLPAGFAGLDLSPVAPLGTSSALGQVSQHKVISTTRGSGVVSDPTNVLALEALTDLLPGQGVRVSSTVFGSPPLAERMRDTVLPALDPLPAGVAVAEDPARERARGYYDRGALRIGIGATGERDAEVGDGGFTNWTARLCGDAKERCLISCVATERLAVLRSRQ